MHSKEHKVVYGTVETQRRWLSVEEVALYLGLTKKAVYEKVHRRMIPFTKLGATLRFDRNQIDGMLEEQSVSPRVREIVK